MYCYGKVLNRVYLRGIFDESVFVLFSIFFLLSRYEFGYWVCYF